MLAYHGDAKIKETYLTRVQAHAVADEIIHGHYWENGKGCADADAAAARSKCYERMADKLIELLEAA